MKNFQGWTRNSSWWTWLVSLVISSGLLSIKPTHGAVHFQNLHTFADGSDPTVILGKDRTLYGTYISREFTTEASAHVFTIQLDGAGYTRLLDFDIATFPLHGLRISALLEGTDGVLYGRVWTTGNGVDQSGFHHVIFSLNKDGSNFRLIHEDNQIAPPQQTLALVEGTDGALYGASTAGIFKLQKDGSGYTDIYDFGSTDEPLLSLCSNHVLYGTTFAGGNLANASGLSGLGSLFSLNEDGSNYRELHAFGGTSDGANPVGGLVEGTDGALYGLTAVSGAQNPDTRATGGATLFKLNKDGSSYRILHVFDSGVDGEVSECPLVRDGAGKLYGTIPWGGADPTSGNVDGFVFGLNEDGSGYTDVYNFGSAPDDGAMPKFGVIQGSDGIFYGTTALGHAASSGGTLFKLWPHETPDMVGVRRTNSSAQLTFGGINGARYQILRSPDLKAWTVLNTITMPGIGFYSFSDNSSPNSRAFYRAAWVP